MAGKHLTSDELLALLTEAPPSIAASTAKLSPAQLQTASEFDAWSANDILAHLRACGDMWGRAIMTILAEDHPTIKAINPRNWINKTDYLTQEFRPSLAIFTTQRDDLLAALRPLPPAEWARSAKVTGAGKPLELTVYSYVERLAIHERSHVNQIARISKLLS